MRMNVAYIRQNLSLRYAIHDTTLTAIAMIDAVTSSMFAIAITAMNVDRRNVLASSAPALATGKMTVVIINPKKQATRSLGATARYRTPSTPSRTNRQGTCGMSA
jgi:hypothetical protein